MASATASDVITGAMRMLNLISEVETMSSEQASRGLTALNEMLHGFSRKGIAYSHSDLGLTDTVNVPDDSVRDVKWMLARQLCDDGYGVIPSPAQVTAMESAYRTLQATFFMARRAPVDGALTPRRGSFNFTRGS